MYDNIAIEYAQGWYISLDLWHKTKKAPHKD